MAYTLVPCFLLEASSKKLHTAQEQSQSEPTSCPGTLVVSLRHCQARTCSCAHTPLATTLEVRVLTCNERVHDDVSGLGLHHRYLVHTFSGR